MRALRLVIVGGAGIALTGCVAAVPVTGPTYTVIPGQNKTEADRRADDAICRGAVPVATGAAAANAIRAAPVTEEQYYGCMASRGEAVIQQQVQAYPVYAGGVPYAYPAYAGYPYGYGYGYPYGGYGFPYGGGYFGPYVGFGVGFGYGGFYGGRGYYHGRGFGGGYGGGYRGGFHR